MQLTLHHVRYVCLSKNDMRRTELHGVLGMGLCRACISFSEINSVVATQLLCHNLWCHFVDPTICTVLSQQTIMLL